MNNYSEEKKSIINQINSVAVYRDQFINKSKYYYSELIRFYKYNTLDDGSVLEIGCGNGYLLNALKPSRGVGIDISPEMIGAAGKKYPHLTFLTMDAENIDIQEKFDYIIMSDTLGYFEDIQKVFFQIKKNTKPSTRIIINYHNFIWSPLLKIAESLGLKMPQKRLNWLNEDDIANLLYLEGYDVIKTGIFLLSNIVNKYIAPLPVINGFCLVGHIIARQNTNESEEKKVSVVIPTRNERGNIENAIRRMPKLGSHTEIIFVEGGSSDGTSEEIKRVVEKYKESHDIKFYTQKGRGKGDAVRLGFEKASGDILMILDADLTVSPEDLTKFYEAISLNKGEYINGTRLVYPMEREAMRTLNMMANKFFSIAFTWILGQKIKDTLCGTKVISKNNYQRLVVSRKYFGDFDPFGDFDLIFGASKLNLKFVEIPIKYKARSYGVTNISRFKHGWLLLKMLALACKKIKFT